MIPKRTEQAWSIPGALFCLGYGQEPQAKQAEEEARAAWVKLGHTHDERVAAVRRRLAGLST